jgi:hypothetical protein
MRAVFNLKKYPKLLRAYHRIVTVKQLYGIPFAVSFVSIIAIEFYFIDKEAPTKFVFHLGQFYLKLCYSFLSSFIFYFLIVHLPKEKRKVKLYLHLQNKMATIYNDVCFFVRDLSSVSGVELDSRFLDISKEQMESALKKINPQLETSYAIGSFVIFHKWHDYLVHLKKILKENIDDIVVYGDSVDSEVIGYLTHIENSTSLLNLGIGLRGYDMTGHTYFFTELCSDTRSMHKAFIKNYRRYRLEFQLSEHLKRIEASKKKKPL